MSYLTEVARGGRFTRGEFFVAIPLIVHGFSTLAAGASQGEPGDFDLRARQYLLRLEQEVRGFTASCYGVVGPGDIFLHAEIPVFPDIYLSGSFKGGHVDLRFQRRSFPDIWNISRRLIVGDVEPDGTGNFRISEAKKRGDLWTPVRETLSAEGCFAGPHPKVVLTPLLDGHSYDKYRITGDASPPRFNLKVIGITGANEKTIVSLDGAVSVLEMEQQASLAARDIRNSYDSSGL